MIRDTPELHQNPAADAEIPPLDFDPEKLRVELLTYRCILLKDVCEKAAVRLGQHAAAPEQDAQPESGPAELPTLLTAWNLLAKADRYGAAKQILLDPTTGGWLVFMEHLLNQKEDDPNLTWHAGNLHTLAAAAAIRAGLDFDECKVPHWGGAVTLSGLGQATLQKDVAGDDQWGVARIQASGNLVTISSDSTSITIPRGGEATDIPGWTPFQSIIFDSLQKADGTAVRVTLDHLNPYRRQTGPIPPNNNPYGLDEERVRAWLNHISGGMRLLIRDHPRLAKTVGEIIHTVVPLTSQPPEIPTRPLSASAESTIGSAEMNWQEGGPGVMASTLAHEIAGHNRLYLEMCKARLTHKDTDRIEQLYAPWRDDVRHAYGLLHGIVSFLEVANFWNDRATLDTPGSPEARLAQFEVAHWRPQLHVATSQLQGRGDLLTPAGQVFLTDVIVPAIERLQTANLPVEALEQAERTVEYNRARWAAHHLAPEQTTAEKALHDWLEGTPAPRDFAGEQLLKPDPNARDLDAWAHMTRILITQPGKLRAGYVPGTTEADIAFFNGDHAKAQMLYTQMLLELATHDDPSAIVGLSFTLGDEAAIFLRKQPYMFRAVQRLIVKETGQPANPVVLAQWLSRGSVAIRA